MPSIIKEIEFLKVFSQRVKQWMSSEEARKNIWADFIDKAPRMFDTLAKVRRDPKTPMARHSMLDRAIQYFINPVDSVPELLVGPVGYLDDLVVGALVITSMATDGAAGQVKKHWKSPPDLMEFVNKILRRGASMVGSERFSKLRQRVELWQADTAGDAS